MTASFPALLVIRLPTCRTETDQGQVATPSEQVKSMACHRFTPLSDVNAVAGGTAGVFACVFAGDDHSFVNPATA
ncbi:hypothetical protein ACFLXE_00505 [Chloroflexota bacterium]